jgi:4-carboxymuconolactone decarboxylase
VLVGEQRGLSDEKLATIVAGQRPVDLTRDEAIAYDFASALVNGGVLPELTYKTAIVAFGQHGAAELSYLVGLYALVSITLNRSTCRYRRLRGALARSLSRLS